MADDVRVEIKLVLVGQKEVLAQADGSVPLFNALTPAARGALACAIETAELLEKEFGPELVIGILRPRITSPPETSHSFLWARPSGSA